MNNIDSFVTGGTGFIGRWLIVELTKQRKNVAILSRDVGRKEKTFKEWITTRGGESDRVWLVEGDLGKPGLGLRKEERNRLKNISDLYHLGSAMSFGLDPNVSKQVNIDGTKRVLELAGEASGLNRFLLVSGYRLRHWVNLGVRPDQIPGEYENSKYHADLLVRAESQGLPVTFVHPSTVIGHSQTGETSQLEFGFSTLVRDLWQGKLAAIPGSRHHWLPLITVDYVAKFLARISHLPESVGQDYTVLDDRTPNLPELFDFIARYMGVPTPKIRIPIPVLNGLSNIKFLSHRMGVDPEALSFIDVNRYDVGPAMAAARKLGLEMPDLEKALRSNIDYMAGTYFGRSDHRVHAGFRRVAGFSTFVQGKADRARLVLLNGLPLDSNAWDPLVERLSVATLRADLPWLGRSGVQKYAFNKGEWLESLLSELPEPPVLIGHSWGAAYALEYAATHPERVDKLVLISPFFLQKPTGVKALSGAVSRDRLEQLITGDSRRSSILDGSFEALNRIKSKTRITRIFIEAYKKRAKWSQMVAELKIPVQIIVGENDPLTDERANRSNHLKVTTIPGASHYPQLDSPEKVANAIIEGW
ncbi:alpha/beta fold hydrolase [Desmospora profundinema]|uniref:Pimeloyl-ACP methyl ester carboxylesterase/nucleoside-diphosphate-sugar epimerase n=1 Tax=Desmospora profundinema TaxID=1571184 RepID=A0ABU1IHZ9_9BACL|nr:alpha/beta fold hydrolase [Desmospora profundinema]MDR6224401.1 pimeloyl-ACP methyl ester carboxylesterase/nucleoside-diphosphate-sugar epimerase [Desmospora profundinema]